MSNRKLAFNHINEALQELELYLFYENHKNNGFYLSLEPLYILAIMQNHGQYGIYKRDFTTSNYHKKRIMDLLSHFSLTKCISQTNNAFTGKRNYELTSAGSLYTKLLLSNSKKSHDVVKNSRIHKWLVAILSFFILLAVIGLVVFFISKLRLGLSTTWVGISGVTAVMSMSLIFIISIIIKTWDINEIFDAIPKSKSSETSFIQFVIKHNLWKIHKSYDDDLKMLDRRIFMKLRKAH